MDPGLRRDDEMGDGASHVADNNLSPQELAKNFPPHCRLIAAIILSKARRRCREIGPVLA
jgi:hypothetical protein